MSKSKRVFWQTISLLMVGLLQFAYVNCGSSESEDEAVTPSNELGDRFSGSIQGALVQITQNNEIFGYALDPENPGYSMRVYFYFNGDADSGEYGGSILAEEGTSGEFAGHYFRFKIPFEYADGNVNRVTLYGHSAANGFIISNSYPYQRFSPRAKDIYDAGIGGEIAGNCVGCHEYFNYEYAFYYLLQNPFSPVDGGSGTNNILFTQVVTGHNTNVCNSGGASDPDCQAIVDWYEAEFGD